MTRSLSSSFRPGIISAGSDRGVGRGSSLPLNGGELLDSGMAGGRGDFGDSKELSGL